jgi:hypothetical protein
MYGKGSAVTVGAAAALFAATDIRAIAVAVAVVVLLTCAALTVRRRVLRRSL